MATGSQTRFESLITTLPKTETASTTFVKQLTNMSLSTLLYLRDVLPSSEFQVQCFEKMEVRILNEKSKGAARRIKSYIDAACEAINKGYLKDLNLEICQVDPPATLELFTIRYNYDANNNASMEILSPRSGTATSQEILQTPRNFRKEITDMIEGCIMMTRRSKPLPDQIELKMQLCYYPHTPWDFEPEGFKPCARPRMLFAKERSSLGLGTVSTKFHEVKLIGRSCLLDQDDVDDLIYKKKSKSPEKNQCEESPEVFKPLTQLLSENHSSPHIPTTGLSTPVNQVIPRTGGLDQEISTLRLTSPSSPNKEVENNENIEPIVEIAPPPSQVSDKYKMRCCCEFDYHAETGILKCSSCSYFVHSECYGITVDANFKMMDFYCLTCHYMKPGAKCFDNILLNTKEEHRQSLAMCRRLVAHVVRVGKRNLIMDNALMWKVCGFSNLQIFKNMVILLGEKMAVIKRKQRCELTLNGCRTFLRDTFNYYVNEKGKTIWRKDDPSLDWAGEKFEKKKATREDRNDDDAFNAPSAKRVKNSAISPLAVYRKPVVSTKGGYLVSRGKINSRER